MEPCSFWNFLLHKTPATSWNWEQNTENHKVIKHLSSTILKCIYHSEAKYQNVNFFTNLQHTSGTSGRVLKVSLPGEPASTRVERKADTLAEASRAVALEQTTFFRDQLDRFLLVSKKVADIFCRDYTLEE